MFCLFFTLVCPLTNFRGTACWGKTPVNRSGEVCVCQHLLWGACQHPPPDTRCKRASTESARPVMLAEVLYPRWWGRADVWRTSWREVSVGFIRSHNPSGIAGSSAASFVFGVNCAAISLLSSERFNENGLLNTSQESDLIVAVQLYFLEWCF